jgi:adenine-specific DNA-methyltransferase
MEKLKMHTPDLADEKFRKLAELFPDAVTETTDEEGNVVRAIDKDVLTQEINTTVVDDGQERYQFTWPDKRKSLILANTSTSKTLRFQPEKSVGRDGIGGGTDSENIYIEGDNLDALKILRETYLGKVKMIYIDPPYNTGSDAFVYDDDYSISNEEYLNLSGERDEDGNILFDMKNNNESNGRFHTDWLNMMYPRIRLAKDFMSNDGVIFISIDYNENFNMRRILNETFGEDNFIGEVYWESKTKSQNTNTSYNKLQPKAEMILVYSKNPKRRFNLIIKGSKEYPLTDEQGKYREYPIEVMNANGIRGRQSMIYGISDGVATVFPPEGKQWKLGQVQVSTYQKQGNLFIRDGKAIIKMRPSFEKNEQTEPFWGLFSKEIGTAESAKKELSDLLPDTGFETVKPVELIKRLIFHATDKEAVILDFFSGSATTAHATMQLNAEDGGNRKFIMVQLPEETVEGSEAYKAGYRTICDIGEERIRRAGKKIKEETGADIDYGFRCFKVDSSNMKDVYYRPAETGQLTLDQLIDNVKEERTPEDLLIQVMLDLGVLLSSKVEETEIAGKKVFSVADGYLIACFDRDITEEVVTEIAKKHPFYAVFRDSSMADDSVAANFEQIFATYSPQTVRKVL